MTWTQKFFSFEGRMGRQDFWICSLVLIGIRFAMFIVLFIAAFGPLMALGMAQDSGRELRDAEAFKALAPMMGAFGVFLLAQLALIWPDLAIKVKRFHDRGQGGAFVALFFLNWVPLLNYLTIIPLFFFWLINLGCLEGTPGPNRYGESLDPRFGPEHAFA